MSHKQTLEAPFDGTLEKSPLFGCKLGRHLSFGKVKGLCTQFAVGSLLISIICIVDIFRFLLRKRSMAMLEEIDTGEYVKIIAAN